jgi:hypothetical protein
MSDWKYIAYTADYSRRIPIIFPGILNHVDVARRLNPLIGQGGRISAPITSAGFLSSLIAGKAYGSSESLDGLGHDGLDSEVINTMPVQHGLVDAFLPGIETMIMMKHVEGLLAQLKGAV